MPRQDPPHSPVAVAMKRKESSSVEGEELDAALNPARGYPRKRVAVACEVCRVRKTKVSGSYALWFGPVE